jgi:hypothetical protein
MKLHISQKGKNCMDMSALVLCHGLPTYDCRIQASSFSLRLRDVLRFVQIKPCSSHGCPKLPKESLNAGRRAHTTRFEDLPHAMLYRDFRSLLVYISLGGVVLHGEGLLTC